MNLWATYCGPCRAETPFFAALHKELGPRGVEFVGLTTEDPARDAQKVREFAREFDVPYRLGWAGRDFARELKRGGSDNIPQTFIYRRDGRLLTRFTGYSAESSPAKIRSAIEQALAAE
ncbi:MAG TPA: TlpA disulfide reductase family protein [Pyrinomonadaceae bacterium]|nr:TlpA disulfide reductase family protein [Pyrinomonadaceae bacterium]